MKKILTIILACLLLFGICACGTTSEEVPPSESIVNHDDHNLTQKLAYDKSRTLGALDVKYDDVNGFFSRSVYGYEFIVDSNAIYFGVCTDEDKATGWGETIENSKQYFYDYLFDAAGFGLEIEQTVASREEVTINDIDWLKVTGSFKNLESGNEFEREYVAYYAMRETSMPDGTTIKVPFHLVGLPQGEESSDTLEGFVDDFVGHITESEDWT